ncbi:hypothetical protein [Acidovorax lacteus]|uniref:Lon N-terminal domain-containing protein n=1 Tax=Acidovorax lacteus TaxID=1924988 RepID=A0ABP8L0E5_9BURK
MLAIAASKYPAPVLADDGIDFSNSDCIRNLVYLEEHDLLRLFKSELMSGDVVVGSVQATAKGMDFLEEDGGLSAILGVVTVKLHDETIKDLLALKIQESDLPPTEKQRWLDQLRELPAETTKHLVLKLVDLGLEKAPDALSAIGRLLGVAL